MKTFSSRLRSLIVCILLSLLLPPSNCYSVLGRRMPSFPHLNIVIRSYYRKGDATGDSPLMFCSSFVPFLMRGFIAT